MKTVLHADPIGTTRIHYQPPENPLGRLDLSHQIAWEMHRCGWDYALDALLPEHNTQGVICDGFLDLTFGNPQAQRHRHPLPFQRPWVGFFHNPPYIPHWIPDAARLDKLLATPLVQASLPWCRGVWTLSEHLAAWLRMLLPVPVSSLLFPTEVPERTFQFEDFLANPHKQILSIGFWLRRQLSIYYLPLDARSPYRKTRLLSSRDAINAVTRACERLEFVHDFGRRGKLDERFRQNTETRSYAPNAEYDDLLSQNLVYLDLHDASANNAVVECIARATPLLVNRLPAVVEYLGADYPFYFDTLEEAADKALDFDLVRRSHEYLRTCPTRAQLTQAYFLESLRRSAVYQGLSGDVTIARQAGA